MTAPVLRPSLRRTLQVGALAAALSCGALLGAAPASADSESFFDGTWDYRVSDPRDDILAVSVSLDATNVSVAVTVAEWDVSFLHNSQLRVTLHADTGSVRREIMKRGDTENAFMPRVSDVFDPDPHCPVTTVYDAATSSVRFTAPAACLGRPSSVRADVQLSSGRSSDSFPGFGQTSRAVSSGPETGPTSPLIGIYRFWDGRRHNYASDPAEALLWSLQSRWEGDVFAVRALVDGDGNEPGCEAGLVPVHQFWSEEGSAFYTANAAEAEHLEHNDPAWFSAGTVNCAYATQEPGTVPLFRFYSPVFHGHFYTADPHEAHIVRTTDRNWTFEGEAYYVLPKLAY